MSLFGDPEVAPSRGTKSSLFDEDDHGAAQKTANDSIFADSAADADGGSPWGFTPRKNNQRRAAGSVVKSLLEDADIPDTYIDSWDALAKGKASIDADEIRDFLRRSTARGEESKIWNIVSNNGEASTIGRGEFNVLLALIGLAQENEELSLDAVDEWRNNLPKPALPETIVEPPPEIIKTPKSQAKPDSKPNGDRSSYEAGFAESDPWASPAVHRGHNHISGIGSNGAQRTTSSFTTSAAEPGDNSTGSGAFTGQPVGNSDGGSWGGSTAFNPTTSGGFASGGANGGGFGDDEANPRPPAVTQRTRSSKGVEEIITISLLEEKEGMFMFQHRNYEVASVRRNSKVIRRYSDFVWLLDCLHKRYPFRQLPLLPPKRVAINGNHIAADNLFLEKRRRGLSRFANTLVRHPVLREEQLVVMFLTVPTELAVWRKQATISVQEEFVGKSLPPTLEDSLPQNLQEIFDTVRGGVRRGADLYINICNLVERLVKRTEAIAGEYGRFSMNLTSITDTSNVIFNIDTNDVPLLNEGINGTAKHASTTQSLLEDESKAWELGFLEDLKSVRDSLVSMRELFDRKDRLARDNIPQLERRIQQNEQKLQSIKAKGDAAKPNEAEKVENAIVNDKQSIIDQHARGVFIKECVRNELLYYQSTIYRISRLHQDWAQERVKYAELMADNFRSMVDAVEGMPLGE